MKLLFENWRNYLTEEQSITLCKEDPQGFKSYYRIEDRENPPSIESILDCWANKNAQVNDSSVNIMRPAMYPTMELVEYREYKREELRNGPGTPRYQELTNKISEEGIADPIIIFFGKNKGIKIGEGNHRHEIAMDLGLEKVPVRYVFWREV